MGSTVLGRTMVLRYLWCRLPPCCSSRSCQSPGSISRMAFYIPAELEGTLESRVTCHCGLVNIHLSISVVWLSMCMSCHQAMCEKKWRSRVKSGYVGTRLFSLETDLGRRAAEGFSVGLLPSILLTDDQRTLTQWTRLWVGPNTQAYVGHLGGPPIGRNVCGTRRLREVLAFPRSSSWHLGCLQRPDPLMDRETWLWNSLLPCCGRVLVWKCPTAWEGE